MLGRFLRSSVSCCPEYSVNHGFVLIIIWHILLLRASCLLSLVSFTVSPDVKRLQEPNFIISLHSSLCDSLDI